MNNKHAKKYVHVAVGIIKNQQNHEVLLAWRDADKHQGNCYEFPGGKVDEGETPREALKRELAEELGIEAITSKKLTELCYDYPEKTVLLHVFLVTDFLGEPHGAEGQEVKWASVDTLPTLTFPAANVPLVRMARLEPTYIITHDITEFVSSIQNKDTLKNIDRWLTFYANELPENAQCYVRVKSLNKSTYVELVKTLHERRPDVQIIAMYCYQTHKELAQMVTGFHLTQSELMTTNALERTNKDCFIVASCHDEKSIAKANALEVDAITISPVNSTQTHPDTQVLGWHAFFDLAKDANCAVYALGGIACDDLQRIESTDVLGLAGIRNLL